MDDIRWFEGSEVRLEYQLTGKAGGEVVLFLHGAGSNLRQFLRQHAHFEAGYQVLSVSLRGHGGSGHPAVKEAARYSLEKNRDDMLELLAHLGMERVHVVGNSAGGVVGLLLAEARPDLLESLVTFGTVGALHYSRATAKAIAGLDRLLLRIAPRGYLRFLSRNLAKEASVQEEILGLFLQGVEGVPYLRENLGSYDCLDTIRSMEVPYLLLRGAHDKEINRSLTSTLEAVADNPRARVLEFPQGGHMANLDHPEAFNQAVERFLDQGRQPLEAVWETWSSEAGDVQEHSDEGGRG